MAATRRQKRVAASQPGFVPLKSNLDNNGNAIFGRRKRVSKNKKKNWNKYSDIHDVEEFLEDVRLQERANGGLIADKPDEILFFVDTGGKERSIQRPEAVKRSKFSKPLHIDLILQPDSCIPAPKNILDYQHPNAKKLRRIAERKEKLAAKGVLPRREKLLQLHKTRAAQGKVKSPNPKDPARGFYDLWSAECPDPADPYYLEQTKRKLVKRPEKLNKKPSILPAVEVIAPGGSYNPDFVSHQTLLLEAHEAEVKKLKAEERLARQLAINTMDIATEKSIFKEQMEGLIEEDEGKEVKEKDNAEVEFKVPMARQEKKNERQRKKEKAERIKELQKAAKKKQLKSQQQLFQLRSIGAALKQREMKTRMRQTKRKAKQEAQKALPRRLGKLKFQDSDLEVQLSDELAGSLRALKPEGSVLQDRFKSLQKRNLIEPRERAKFKRKHKVKYVEKRAFGEIQ